MTDRSRPHRIRMPDAPEVSEVLDRPEGMTLSELVWYNRVWGYDEHAKRVEVRGDAFPEPALTGHPPRDSSEYFRSPKMPKALPKGAKSKRSAIVKVPTDATKIEARGVPLAERRSTGHLACDSGDPLSDGSGFFQSPIDAQNSTKRCKIKEISCRQSPDGCDQI